MDEPAAPSEADDLRALLAAAGKGDRLAREQLIALVYPELHRLAAHYLRLERPEHTLQTTALTHEAYLRLFGGAAIEWQDRSHFFALAACQMRRVLVDHARARNAGKRPGQFTRLPLEAIRELGEGPDEDLLALDEALSALAGVDRRASEVVELRFFGGLEERETAHVLGISIATVKRDWTFAKAWLFNRLKSVRLG
jgi:RNA polymerase sigma factor (TIGR02999 family)